MEPLRDMDDVFAQVEAYKQQNPRLAEALRLFGVTDEQYQASLNAIQGARFYWTTSANATIQRDAQTGNQ